MHNFTSMDEVESTLQQLAQREPPLARVLPREPGAREVRYVHLLSPPVEAASAAISAPAHQTAHQTQTIHDGVSERVTSLESEIAQLRARVASLEDKLAQLLG
jgi:hypothetical protein